MSPRTEEQNRLVREARRGQIVRAAWEEYLEKGSRDFEVAAVAQASGLGKGTVYHYFPTRKELLRAVILWGLQVRGERVDRVLKEGGEVMGQLRAVVRIQLETLVRKPTLFRFFRDVMADARRFFPEGHEAVLEGFQATQSGVRALFVRGMEENKIRAMDPDRLTVLFWGGMVGMISLFLDARTLQNDPDVVDQVLTLMLEGLSPVRGGDL